MKEKMDMKLYKIIMSLVLFITGLLSKSVSNVAFVLFLTSYIIIGYEVIKEAIEDIFHGEIFGEEFLMTLATIGAFVIGEYAEAVAIMLFFQIGEYLQDRAIEKSKNLISSLASLKSEKTTILVGNKEKVIDTEKVKIGDTILVKPGEKISLDGDVLKGTSTIDTKAITGESIPSKVEKGSHVMSGCVNLSGVLTIKVTNDESTSTVTKILSLMENADRDKTSTESFITRFAHIYTPIVVILALMICLVPVFIGGSFKAWLYRAFVFLTISCPCALVISIPLGFISGLGVLSKHGILVKGTNHIETLEQVDTVVFDKTGTLTEGTFEVQEVEVKKGVKKEELLKYAALAEQYSNHPIAHAILSSNKEKISKKDLSHYQEIAGKGIFVLYKKKVLLVGNANLMKENNISYNGKNKVGSIVYVAYDNQYLGSILVADKVREDAKTTIEELKKIGVQKIYILSGDHEGNVKPLVKELGITDYYANLLPQEKVEKVLSLKENTKGKVMFLGDGINDAPVIVHADLGVSMGGIGSDAAIETSDMILMNDHLSSIPVGIRIAKKTKQVVWQNILFAFFVKVFVLILGAFGIATIWHAVFADVGVTILVILYSFTIYFHDYKGLD